MSTTTMTKTDIENRIKEIEATPQALIGSDEGTHAKPRQYRLYEEITGERYAVSSFGGASGTRCTIQDAVDGTAGVIRWFSSEKQNIDRKRAELAELKQQLRKAK